MHSINLHFTYLLLDVALQTTGSSTPLGLPMSAINSRLRTVSSVQPASAGIYNRLIFRTSAYLCICTCIFFSSLLFTPSLPEGEV